MNKITQSMINSLLSFTVIFQFFYASVVLATPLPDFLIEHFPDDSSCKNLVTLEEFMHKQYKDYIDIPSTTEYRSHHSLSYDPLMWRKNRQALIPSWDFPIDIETWTNCYSYACNRAPSFHPGLISRNPHFSTESLENDLNVVGILNRALKDGLKPYPVEKGYPVYFVVSTNKDYHWYRQDRCKFWSHKSNGSVVKNRDALGRLIINPIMANHNYLAANTGQANYNEGGCFLWVPPNFGEGLEKDFIPIQQPENLLPRVTPYRSDAL